MMNILVENNFMVELDFQMVKLGSPGTSIFLHLLQTLQLRLTTLPPSYLHAGGSSLRLNDGSGLKTSSEVGWGLVGPTGSQLLDLCSSSVSVVVLLLSTYLVSSQH